MGNRRRLAAVATAALVAGAVVSGDVTGTTTPREVVLADLTALSCDVLQHDHDAASLFAADAALRAVIQQVSLSSIVETPSLFGRSDERTILSLAREAQVRFKNPPDRILADAAATADAAVVRLAAGRTGPDAAEDAWFFAPMRSWTVHEGTVFDVALGMCPGVAPGPGTAVRVTSSNQTVLADSAVTVTGGVLTVRTAPYPDTGTTGTVLTVVVTTASGLGATVAIPVSVVHVATVPVETPAPPAPAPVETPPAETPAPVETPAPELPPTEDVVPAETPAPVETPAPELPPAEDVVPAETPAPVETPAPELPPAEDAVPAETPAPVETPAPELPPAEDPLPAELPAPQPDEATTTTTTTTTTTVPPVPEPEPVVPPVVPEPAPLPETPTTTAPTSSSGSGSYRDPQREARRRDKDTPKAPRATRSKVRVPKS